MFSSLRLADGDLNIYDIERLGRIPSTVVLSACDSGFTDSRPGEELTGLTSALLRMGAKTVIASVGLVPDSEATRQFMVGFHTGLANGHTPAHALRLARDWVKDTPGGDIAAASFICVGSS
jgi:CHAT domain-containing protein